MTPNFERWECREANELEVVLFDIEGFKNIVVTIKINDLINFISDEKLNWGYPLEPDDFVQVCKPVTYWIENKESVIKQYITEKLK